MEIIDIEQISNDLTEEIVWTDSNGVEIPKNEGTPVLKKPSRILPNAVYHFIRFAQIPHLKGSWVSLIGKVISIESLSNILNIDSDSDIYQEDVTEVSNEINFANQPLNITIEDSEGVKAIINKWILGEKISNKDVVLFRVRIFKKHPTEHNSKIFLLYMGHKVLSKNKNIEENSNEENQIKLDQIELMIDLFNKTHSYYWF